MRVQRIIGGWIVEAYTDWSALIVGATWLTGHFAYGYLHIGPVHVGFFRDSRPR